MRAAGHLYPCTVHSHVLLHTDPIGQFFTVALILNEVASTWKSAVLHNELSQLLGHVMSATSIFAKDWKGTCNGGQRHFVHFI